jgi:hypothetical protein
MSNIFDDANATLVSLNVPYAYKVYLPETGVELPNTFLTYFLITDVPVQFADNQMTEERNHIQVSVYSRTGFTGNLLDRIHAAMESAGFMRGPVTDLPFDQVTRHFGLALEYSKL